MKKPCPVFPVTVKDHKLVISKTQREQMRRWLRTFQDGEAELIVQRKRNPRSLDQNAYWHAIPVNLMADEWGVSHDQAHYLLLGEWKGYIDGPLGRLPICASSSKLTRDEFSELITWVLDYGPAEWNVYIPAPSEANWKAA